MFLNKGIPLIFFSTLVISACGSDGTPEEQTLITEKSTDVIYSSVSVLGSNVNDGTALDAGAEISANGLELYFHSTRAGGSGRMDLYVATRDFVADNWKAATSLGATFNTASDDRAPSISNDGLTLFFASDRAGGEGDIDLYMSTRASIADPWSAPTNLGNIINTTFLESGPSISADGLSLYFHSDVPGFGNTDLYVSTRVTALDPWEPPTNLGGVVNSAVFEAAVDIASDGLSLYFHSDSPGGPGLFNIWRSTRTSVNSAWGAPVVVPAPVSTTDIEVGPSISDDWQTLYFTRDTGGNRDIWQAVP